MFQESSLLSNIDQKTNQNEIKYIINPHGGSAIKIVDEAANTINYEMENHSRNSCCYKMLHCAKQSVWIFRIVLVLIGTLFGVVVAHYRPIESLTGVFHNPITNNNNDTTTTTIMPFTAAGQSKIESLVSMMMMKYIPLKYNDNNNNNNNNFKPEHDNDFKHRVDNIKDPQLLREDLQSLKFYEMATKNSIPADDDDDDDDKIVNNPTDILFDSNYNDTHTDKKNSDFDVGAYNNSDVSNNNY